MGTVRDRFERGVQIRTAGVRKCRSLHFVCNGLVNIFEQSNVHTPGVQGATGPPNLVHLVYTEPNATVRRPTSDSCTDPYTRRTKMSFAVDCLPRPGKDPGAV